MNEIEILIQELEKEQASLKRLIEDSVQSQEFLMAHFHAEALVDINKQLQTLRNLEDKNFDNKTSMESSIRIYEKQLELDHSDTFKRHLQSQVLRLKQELDQLNEHNKVGSVESDVLTRYLESFVRNKLKGIKVILQKSSGFILLIKKHRSGVKIMIPNLKALRKNYVINDENIRHFYSLGFTIGNRESQLMLILSREQNNLLTELKKIIVKSCLKYSISEILQTIHLLKLMSRLKIRTDENICTNFPDNLWTFHVMCQEGRSADK